MGNIDINAIPRSHGMMLGTVVFDAIAAFYADPKNQEAFERWKKEQGRKEATA